jgi:membrane protease YdiL (CAAX protease family)
LTSFGAEPPDDDANPPLADAEPSSASSRPGASTFTIDGRAAPALFVVGWLATILGIGLLSISAMSGAAGPVVVAIGGYVLLSIGLIAAAGSQGIERRARGVLPYVGPSPILVFAAAVPLSALAGGLIALGLIAVGVDLLGPIAQVASISMLALIYVGLIRLLVIDTGALTWAEMGLRRLDAQAVVEAMGGALWAVPVIALTVPISALLLRVFPVAPVSPLPPAGETGGFILQLAAGAIIAPFAEELLFRGFATTAWVRGLGVSRGILRGALVFAIAHVINVSGSTFEATFGLAVVGFATRVPIAIALGWLFVRRGSIWASFGLHATFNAVLLVIGEVAARSIVH